MKLISVKPCSFFLALFVSLSVIGQNRFVLDTIVIQSDSMVLYSDKSWEKLNMAGFDGILLPSLRKTLNKEHGGKWVNPWVDDDVYTTKNDLNKLTDTLWLCLVNEEHPEFYIPNGGKVNSRYGQRGKRFHKGIDIGFNKGDSIHSVFDGIVRYARYNNGGYGNLVIVRHYNGLETYYAHLSKFNVYANQKVKAGEFLGVGGTTGRSTGPHLHFELRFYGFALAPGSVIDFNKGELKSENLFIHKNKFPYTAKTTTSSSSKSSSAKYHKIKSGDTLLVLASKYETSLNKICKLNKIKPEKILQIGEMIQVK